MPASRLSLRVRPYLAAVAGRIRADSPFHAAIAWYCVAGLVFLTAADAWDKAAYAVYVQRWLLVFGVLLPLIATTIHAARLLHRFDRRRKLAASRYFAAENVAHFIAGVALLVALMVFQGTFTSIKNALPVWVGDFPHDRMQADIDAWLHFGVDPWRYLMSGAGTASVRSVVEWNYNVLWFVICFGALFFVATTPAVAGIRRRYLFCFMLVWIVVGNLLAGTFLSAGPAYYGLVTGDTARFGDQLAFLAQGADSANSAAVYQSYLWSLHMSGQAGFGSGISAFPSVHVALAMLNALFIFEWNRRLGLLAFAYVGFVAASSVYLAWHYAIDGYVAAAVTFGLYAIVRRLERFGAARRHETLRQVATAS
jgi:hypothetical protein